MSISEIEQTITDEQYSYNNCCIYVSHFGMVHRRETSL